MDEYIGGLTVHGLTRVFTGTRVESFFWFGMLSLGSLLTFFVVFGLVKKYTEHHVYVQISSQMVDEKPFPSVTICDENKVLENYNAYCGMPCLLHDTKSSQHVCQEKWMHLKTKESRKTLDDHWTNGLFTVTRCTTWGGKRCNSFKYFKSIHRYNGACITFNFNGNFSDIYGHFQIDFNYNHTEALEPPNRETSIVVLPHDPSILELDFTIKNQLEPMKTLTMVYDNTITKRLPSPFPSNCTSEKLIDIFPGGYSRRACIETQNYLQMYEKCGDVADYVRQYMPQEIHRRFARNKTIADTCKCIHEFSKLEIFRVQCPFPCDETEISVLTNFNRWKKGEVERSTKLMNTHNLSSFRLDFQYQSVDSYRLIEEMELYTLYQMASEIGGFLGLVIGASILSFIEIFTLISLSIYRRFQYQKFK